MKIYRAISPKRVQFRSTSSFGALKLAKTYLPEFKILRIFFLFTIPFLRFFQKGEELDEDTARLIDELNMKDIRNLTIFKSSARSRFLVSIENKIGETIFIKFGAKTDYGLVRELDFFKYVQGLDDNSLLIKPFNFGYTKSYAFLVFPYIEKSLLRQVKLQDWQDVEKTLILLDVRHDDLKYWNILKSKKSENFLIDWETWSKGKSINEDFAIFKKSIEQKKKNRRGILSRIEQKNGIFRKLKNKDIFFLASQATSSIGNYLLNILMAFYALNPSQFGAFAFSYIVYIFGLGFFRATTIDPLLYSRSESFNLTKKFIRPAVFNSLGISLFIVVIASQIDGQIGHFLLMLSIGFPGILLQDSFRFYFFSCDNAFGAFILDFIWTLFYISGVLIFYLFSIKLSLNIIFCFWLCSANIVTLFMILYFRELLRNGRYLIWYRNRGRLFFNSLIDYIVTYGAPSLFVLFLVRESSLNQIAGYRSATAILAFGAISIASFSVSELRRFIAHQGSVSDFFPKSLRRVLLGPILLIVVIFASSSFLHRVFPVLLLGENWNYAESFMIPLSISYIFIALGTIPRVYLKGTNQIAQLRKLGTPGFLLVTCAFFPIYQFYGLIGFGWILASSNAITLVLALLFYRYSKIREYEK